MPYRLYIDDVIAFFLANDIIEAWSKALKYCQRNGHNPQNLEIEEAEYESDYFFNNQTTFLTRRNHEYSLHQRL